METKIQLPEQTDSMNVLLIGNNPIDMSSMLDKLNQIHGTKVITEIAFDLRSIVERLVSFKPNYILIDDNIGRFGLSQAIDALAKSNKTKNVPIAVLKNSNYEEAYSSLGVLDYLLKNTLTADSLYKTLKNSLKFRRTQAFLSNTYKNRKKLFSLIYN